MGAVKQFIHTYIMRALGIFSSGEMNAVEGKEGQRPQETQRAWGEPLEAQTSTGKGQVSNCNRKAGREGQGRVTPLSNRSFPQPSLSCHICPCVLTSQAPPDLTL